MDGWMDGLLNESPQEGSTESPPRPGVRTESFVIDLFSEGSVRSHQRRRRSSSALAHCRLESLLFLLLLIPVITSSQREFSASAMCLAPAAVSRAEVIRFGGF